ncbi:hypothetical protein [Acidithiobacillus ferrooxidans]|uniref:hypothetical protein n=1 Tax=Acidithiobacillus ferrooxidans TaxID=920 RepID=UPI001C0727AC|nr:hypothetical protein [Acidithiobacillus ferrooxidans]
MKIRMFGIRLPAALRVVATLVPVSVIIAPFPVHADSFMGSLWIPGIALNIGQPAYEPFRHLPDYPGYAATPYSYSGKSYQRVEKYQQRLVKRERKADHRYWKALRKSEKTGPQSGKEV